MDDFQVQQGFVLPHWLYWSALAFFPLFYMALDRWRQGDTPEDAAAESEKEALPTSEEIEAAASKAAQDDWEAPGNAFTRVADRISSFSGVFVSYWIVIAVVIYSYEVVSRYFFNAPTNWVHEAAFLMFGMMYVMSGAYGYLHKAHVRVDVLYIKLDQRQRAALDIVLWLFFLVFTIVFLTTCWTFFAQAADQNMFFFGQGYANDLSQSEWQIQYLPVKGLMVLGTVLLLIQGIAGLIKDVQTFAHLEGELSHD